MKIETQEIVTIKKVAKLSIKEAKKINDVLEIDLNNLSNCGGIAYETMKSYNRHYSPSAINEEETNKIDFLSLLSSSLQFITYTTIDSLLATAEELYAEYDDVVEDIIHDEIEKYTHTYGYEESEEYQTAYRKQELILREKLNKYTKIVKVLKKLKNGNIDDITL